MPPRADALRPLPPFSLRRRRDLRAARLPYPPPPGLAAAPASGVRAHPCERAPGSDPRPPPRPRRSLQEHGGVGGGQRRRGGECRGRGRAGKLGGPGRGLRSGGAAGSAVPVSRRGLGAPGLGGAGQEGAGQVRAGRVGVHVG